MKFTLVIRYSVPGEIPPRNTRNVPWNWEPSKTEIMDTIRRLRSQEPDAIVHSAELIQHTTVLTWENPCGDSLSS